MYLKCIVETRVGYLKDVFCIFVFWVVDILFGCSGFSCEWVIWEFSLKSAVSSVSASGCFSRCGWLS